MHRGMHASVQELGEYETRVTDWGAVAYTVASLETFRRYSFRVCVRNMNQLGYVNCATGCRPSPLCLLCGRLQFYYYSSYIIYNIYL